MTTNRWHRNLGRVKVTDACRELNRTNPDPTSTFVEHDGDVKEVTRALLTDEDPEARPHDCAAAGAPTKSCPRALIDDEQRECTGCGHSVRWDLTESGFWGFASNCPHGDPPEPKE